MARTGITLSLLLLQSTVYSLQPAATTARRPGRTASTSATMLPAIAAQRPPSRATLFAAAPAAEPPKSGLVPSWAVTTFLIVLWYYFSIVCNQASKVLLSTT